MKFVSKVVKLPPVIGENCPPPQIAAAASERHSRRMRMHPFSGALMLLVDNICFGATTLTSGLALPLVAIGAFTITSFGVFLAQKFLDRDGFGESLAKAFFAGVMTGIPTPIMGTIVGALIMGISGLDAMKNDQRTPEPRSR